MNSNNEKKFLVDAMLGNIVKKLRVMGFDAEYSSDKSDEEIITIIENNDRILITKDEELSKKVKKLGFESIFVTGDDELLHFRQIKQNADLLGPFGKRSPTPTAELDRFVALQHAAPIPHFEE